MQPTKKITGEIKIKCKEDWNECQKQQACSKIRRLNNRAKNNGPLVNVAKTKPASYPDLREEGNAYARAYDGTNYAHDCMKTTQGRAENQGRAMNADHIHEVQLGGDPAGPFMWLDESVNKSIGSQISKKKETHITGVKSQDCEPVC